MVAVLAAVTVEEDINVLLYFGRDKECGIGGIVQRLDFACAELDQIIDSAARARKHARVLAQVGALVDTKACAETREARQTSRHVPVVEIRRHAEALFE